jgi:hypothetical protein
LSTMSDRPSCPGVAWTASKCTIASRVL